MIPKSDKSISQKNKQTRDRKVPFEAIKTRIFDVPKKLEVLTLDYIFCYSEKIIKNIDFFVMEIS